MKIKYDPVADAMIITFNTNRIVNTKVAHPHINIDLDADGKPVSIELLTLKRFVDSPVPDYVEGDGYISVEDMAAMKGVSSRRIRALIEERAIVAFKVGEGRRGNWLILRESAEAWEPKPVGRPKKEPSEA